MSKITDSKKVELGESKAIPLIAVEFVKDDGKEEILLCAIVHVPTHKQGDQQFFKAIGVKSPITREHLAQIAQMFTEATAHG